MGGCLPMEHYVLIYPWNAMPWGLPGTEFRGTFWATGGGGRWESCRRAAFCLWKHLMRPTQFNHLSRVLIIQMISISSWFNSNCCVLQYSKSDVFFKKYLSPMSILFIHKIVYFLIKHPRFPHFPFWKILSIHLVWAFSSQALLPNSTEISFWNNHHNTETLCSKCHLYVRSTVTQSYSYFIFFPPTLAIVFCIPPLHIIFFMVILNWDPDGSI